MNWSEVKPAHVVIAGPSCVPFSTSGSENRWGDAKSLSFTACVRAIVSQATREDSVLKFFMVENVAGFSHVKKGGTESPLQEVSSYLAEQLSSDWFIWSWACQTASCGLPQYRERVYLCGRLKRWFRLPAPRISPSDVFLRRPPLEAFLDQGLSSQFHALTAKMKVNLKWYREFHEARTPPGTQVLVIADLTRSADVVRKPMHRCDGIVMTLTTRNRSLWIFSVPGGRFERFLTDAERLRLQGWDPSLVMDRIPQQFRAIAAGNAMSMPVVALVFACAWADFNA